MSDDDATEDANASADAAEPDGETGADAGERRGAADGEADGADESAPAADEADGGTETGDDAESEPDRPLSDRVADRDEALGAEVAALEEEAAALEAERDDLESEAEDLRDRLQRTQADFQNYKKRSKRREEEIRERASEDVVEQLLDVRDNLARALDQEEGADIRDGVEATLREFDRVLAEEDVERIDPDPGTEVDPQRHEVMMRVDSDQPADTVAEVYRPGYEMAGKVLREAQVTVSDG